MIPRGLICRMKTFRAAEGADDGCTCEGSDSQETHHVGSHYPVSPVGQPPGFPSPPCQPRSQACPGWKSVSTPEKQECHFPKELKPRGTQSLPTCQAVQHPGSMSARWNPFPLESIGVLGAPSHPHAGPVRSGSVQGTLIQVHKALTQWEGRGPAPTWGP